MENKKNLYIKYIKEKILSNYDELKKDWETPDTRTTTRHIAIDNLLPQDLAEEVFESFPKGGNDWKEMSSFREKKRTLAQIGKVSKVINDITYAIQSKEIVSLIGELTDIHGLKPDPLLYAGGISLMEKGDFLNPHIDNSHNSNRTMYRKLNILYYVSPSWSSENGGNLELWDEKVTQPLEITSAFNRLVLMETNKLSWHSVNQVKADSFRCCVSNYYFAEGPQPYDKDYYHVTSFMARPGETTKRLFSNIDNIARQFVAKNFSLSRGRTLVNEVDSDNP